MRPIAGFVRNTCWLGRNITWPSKIIGNIKLENYALDVTVVQMVNGGTGNGSRWPCKIRISTDQEGFEKGGEKAQVYHDDKLGALIKLLLRWSRLLEKNAASALRERQKVVRQHMNDKKERKRFEASEKRRLRAEERLRRENLRKRMKSDFMDDLFGQHKKGAGREAEASKRWMMLRLRKYFFWFIVRPFFLTFHIVSG